MVGPSPLRAQPPSLGNFRAIAISWSAAAGFPAAIYGAGGRESSKEGPHWWKASPSISQQRTDLEIFRAWQRAHLLIRIEKRGFLLFKKNNTFCENNLIP